MAKISPYSKLAFLVGASLVPAWPALHATFSLATQQDEYTHILLIVPIVAAFLYLDRPAFKIASANPRVGSMILAASLFAALATNGQRASLASDVQLSLYMFALVSWWIGSFIFSFGVNFARRERFALGFLYWLVPWPNSVLDIAVGWLQRESALAARWMFALSRTPVTLDDTVLVLPGLTLNVAPECSSLRSSLLLIITTMIFAQLFLRSPWRKLALVLAAILLSPVKNGLRIFVIGYLTLRVDPTYLTGHLHHDGGIVFLAAVQAIIFGLLWVLRRGEMMGASSASVQRVAH
jgi:exosortase